MMKSQTINGSSRFVVSTKAGTNPGQMKMKNLRKDQRGFSMMELLMVIALTGIITAAITTAFFQVFDMSTRTANHMIAVTQVQQAGKLVSEDIMEAQNVIAGGGSGFPLTLNWTDWGTNNTHGVIYSLDVMSRILWRSHYVNLVLDSTTKVAEQIGLDGTDCAPLGLLPPGATLNFTVTATVGDESETRVYQIRPRPGT